MNMLKPIFRLYVAATALLLLTQAAWAGKEDGIEIRVGAGNVAGILEKETDIHLNAIRQVVLTRPGFHSDGSRMSELQKRVWESTVARIDYTYQTKAGGSVTRSYHARSGQSIGGMMDAITNNVSSSGSSSSGSGSGSGMPSANDLDILKDAEESRYYPSDDLEHVRVRNLNPRNSTVQVANAQYRRVRDAELKALRQIEFDIKQGVVPEGGRIVGYVSQPPCDSCTNVIRNFGEQFRVSGDVYHLVPGTPNPAATGEIAESNRAAGQYFRTRKRAVQSVLQANRVRPPASIAWGIDTTETIGALQAAEQGRLDVTQPCRH